MLSSIACKLAKWQLIACLRSVTTVSLNHSLHRTRCGKCILTEYEAHQQIMSSFYASDRDTVREGRLRIKIAEYRPNIRTTNTVCSLTDVLVIQDQHAHSL